MNTVLQAALRAGVILLEQDGALRLRVQSPIAPELRQALAGIKSDLLGLLAGGRRIGPATAAQAEIWLADRTGAAFTLAAASRIRRHLDPSQIQAALTALAGRHPALRTRLLMVQDEPAQLVEVGTALVLARAEADGLDAARTMAAAFAAGPFDPATAPPIRALLARLAPDDWVFTLAVHHTACDAASLDLIAVELDALSRGLTLPPPGPDMLDHAAMARVAVDEAAHLAWWRTSLQDTPALTLGGEPLEPATGTGRLGALLPAAAWQSLCDAARLQGATPFGGLFGLLAAVVGRRSGQRRFVLHMPVTSRTEIHAASVGCFAGLLPVRAEATPDAGRDAMLRQGGRAVADALAHSGPTLGQIAAIADTAARPVLLVTHRDDLAARKTKDNAAGIETLVLDGGRPKAPLVLETAVTPEGLAISLEWDRSLLDDAVAAAILEEFTARCRDSAAPFQSRERALHAALADNIASFPRDASIPALFSRVVASQPDATALRWVGRSLRYHTLDLWSDRIADLLGAARGGVVGVPLPRGPAMVAAWLGCLKAGAAYLPLDPTHPPLRQAAMLEDARAVRSLTEAEVLAAMPPDEPRAHGTQAREPVHPLAIAYVVFTSGSTGRPKPVAIPHRAVLNLVCGADYAVIAPGDIVAQASNAAFDAATWEVWGALLNGATLQGIETDDLLDPDRLAGTLRIDGITHMFLTTALFNAAVTVRADSFAGVRCLLVGGEPQDPALCGKAIVPAGVVNIYGPTETTTFAAWQPIPEHVGTLRRVPVGGPIRNTILRVLDPWLRPAAPGAAAELFVAGDSLAQGYLGQPGRTAEAFLPDPFGAAGTRLYRTGDRARLLPDGRIDIIGRRDAQVKLRGFRVEPGEVAFALRQLPDVLAAHVSAVRNADGTMGLQAWIVGQTPELARRLLEERLPSYMIPSRIVRLDRLPVTASGKIDEAALQVPDATAVEPPVGATEQQVAAILCEVLGLSAIGRDQDIFTLGAHSLSAMRILARLRAGSGAGLALRDVFEAPTVAGLAALLPGPATMPDAGAEVPLPRGTGPMLLQAQERIWLMTRLGDPAAWNIPFAMRLRGALDIQRLRHVLDQLHARHAALRTALVERDGRPVAVEHPPGPMPFSHKAPPDGLAQALADEAAGPFDLQSGSLIRATLFDMADGSYVFCLVMHHVAADGWSLAVLLREAAALYRGETLKPLVASVADYAAWQRGQDVDADIDWWAEQLTDAAELTLPRLAIAPATSADPTPSGCMVYRRLPEALHRRLLQRAAEARVTPFMLALAAWSCVLARVSGERDVVVGTVLAGRERPELEDLVGMLAQTVPLRLMLAGDRTLQAILGQARDVLLGAHHHAAVPFERIVGAAGKAGSGTALVQHLIVLQNQPWDSSTLGDVTVETLLVAPTAAKHHTTLALDAEARNIALEFASPLDPASADWLLGQFEAMLAAFADNPEQHLSALLPDGAVSLLHGASTVTPEPSLLHRGPAHAAALVDGPVSLDSGTLWARVEALAATLHAHGAGPETLVGIASARSAAQVIAILATIQAGAAWLPLESDLPLARLDSLLKAAAPILILADPAAVPRLAASMHSHIPCIPIEGDAGPPLHASDFAEAHPLALAYVLFTSGSTGEPKGVSVSRQALASHMAWMDRMLPLVSDDRLLLKTTIGFDASIWEYLAAFRSGASLHVAPPDAHRDPAALLRAIAASGATVVQLVPTMLALLARQADFEPACRTLRRICVGGEAMPRALADEVRRRLGCAIVNLYGPAEATIQTLVQVGLPETRVQPAAGETMPIGRPIDGVTAWLTDPWGALVPQGVAGRLWLSGAALARGYLDRPDLTAERFRPNPFGPSGSRALDTADLALLDADGLFIWRGRLDGQAKLRGMRFELGEVEAALMAVPGVHAAAARLAGTPSGPILAGWVVAPGLDEATIQAGLAASLPTAARPSRLVLMDALPRLRSGKLDRRALTLPALTRRLADDLLEETVCALFAGLLGCGTVSPDDDFFMLGGHSLLAAQLASRLSEATGTTLPLLAIFEAPTPAGLAARLRDAMTEGQPDKAPPRLLPRGADLPLSSAQRRLWAAVRLGEIRDGWTMGGPVILHGIVDASALEGALGAIERRHEALRTVFPETDGLARQRILPPAFRLERSEAADRDAALADAVSFMGRPFDLGTGPLFRARLTRAPGLSVLTLAVHHLVADGWSFGVLMRELGSLLAGQSLPPLTAQYADVAHWMDSEATTDGIAWWRTRLHGLPPLRLPGERAATGTDAAMPGCVRLPIRLDGTAMRLAAACGATPFMVLAAAFAASLFAVTGQRDIGLGTDVADRRHRVTESLIGFFANPVVLRLDLSGDPSGRTLVQRVRQVALDAYAHQSIPSDRVMTGQGAIRAKLTWQGIQGFPASLTGAAAEWPDMTPAAIPADLLVNLMQTPDGIAGALLYRPAVLDDVAMRGLLERMDRLVRMMAAEPDRPLSALLAPEPSRFAHGSLRRRVLT